MPILLATAAVVPPAEARAQGVPAVPEDGQETTSDDDGIPDIVVTARKREQRLHLVLTRKFGLFRYR